MKFLKRHWKKLVGALLVLILLFFGFILSVQWGLFGKIPDADDLKSVKNYLASEVYSEDGVLIGKYYVQNRTGASLEEIPQHLIDALIATEDVRFFEHDGVDKRSLVRVFVKSIILQDESSGGGSTLTQQLAQNLFGRGSHGVFTMPVAKIKEHIIAKRLEKVYTKEQILELYFNTVSFGENVYGVETASLRYFNKKPEKLTISEAAVLVGILKANTYYNPNRNPEKALERRNVVLHQMAKYDFIAPQIADSLKALPLTIDYYNLEKVQPAPYFMAWLRPQVREILKDIKKPDGSDYDLDTDGLIVETTLNHKLQSFAAKAIKEHMISLQKQFDEHWKNRDPWPDKSNLISTEVKKTRRYQALKKDGASEARINEVFNTPVWMTRYNPEEGDELEQVEVSPLDSIKYYQRLLHCGFYAVQPQTGEVKVWIGGRNFKFLPYDHVTTRRQSASTFKPFVYAAALEKGTDPCTYTENVQRTYEAYNNYSPRNADNEYGEFYSMRGALKKSLNVVAVQVAFETGLHNVTAYARNLGIESPLKAVPSMALGTNEATLYEMTNAYAAFANGGRRISPYAITRITDAFGNDLYRAKKTVFPQVTDTLTAKIITHLLQSVIKEGTATRARTVYGLRGDYAGKTGTAQNNTDGWFIGYNPSLTAGVWVGASSPEVRFRSTRLGSGANMALPMWAKFFRQVEVSAERRKYLSNFAPLGDSLQTYLDCPDERSPDLIERLGKFFSRDGTIETDTVTGEKRSFWDRVFGRKKEE